MHFLPKIYTVRGERIEMTVRELIDLADAIKENEIGEDVKLRWINDIEGRVFCEIYKRPHESFCPRVSDSEGLSVPEPYSSLYLPYLIAMIAFTKGEYESYKSAMLEYEAAFLLYAKYYIRSRR